METLGNLKQFVQNTLSNNGCSYNLITTEINPNKGYMVAIPEKELIIANFDKLTEKALQYKVAEFIKVNALILIGGTVDENYFIGSWVDNNKLYLDISVNVSIKNEAEFLGRKYKQIAIWDCANLTSINL